jgi:hypothetical protein
MTESADHRLSREEAAETLGVDPELLDRLERSGALRPDAEGTYDVLALAGAVVRHGLQRRSAADRKLAQVGVALGEVRPALERLSVLPDKTGLQGEAYERVMIEVAAFFTAFAAVMNKATAALNEGSEESASEA